MNKKGISTEATKIAFFEAMSKTFGNVSASCRAVGIDRTLPYRWAKEDPDFELKFNSNIYEEMFLDAIDSKLAKVALQDENPTVLIFLAKTKGKKRGYVEKTETDITTQGEKIAAQIITTLSPAELAEYLKK